ncbi:regulator [Streptomyces venezuelae]|uniref:regulator n=1 Tax=Streptomyces venezuelae TaxID=54571 RepID=UPI003669DFD3
MTTPLTSAEAHRAVELLASRSLIRLVTEIDDNGAIPPRRLAGTLPDLSSHQLRCACETARTHALVRTAPGSGLELTAAGTELADLYDTAARWARHHAYPAPVSEFSSRIRHVLELLAPALTPHNLSPGSIAGLLSDDAEAELARPRTLLIQWLASNPQVTRAFEPTPVT